MQEEERMQQLLKHIPAGLLVERPTAGNVVKQLAASDLVLVDAGYLLFFAIFLMQSY